MNRLTLVILTIFLCGQSIAQNVGIGDAGSSFTPVASSLLELKSTTKGLLAPRMTTAEKNAISSPATGLLVYDTTLNLFYYYNASAWVPLFSNANGWSLTGNASTTAGTNYLGTSDAIDLVFKTTASERMRITAGGNVGIGATVPRGHFDVDGSGDIWLTDDGLNSATQSIYFPGHIFMAPYGGANTVYLQARRSDNSGSTNLQIRTTNAGVITESVFVQNDGKVGIGTTSPSNLLHVQSANASAIFASTGNAANYGGIAIGRTAEEARFVIAGAALHYSTSSSAGDIILRVDNSAQKLIMQAGNGAGVLGVTNTSVGVGTMSPGYTFDVEGTSTTLAKIGTSFPVYFTANSPSISFNSYWGGAAWLFGKGSTAHYGANLAFSQTTGAMGFQISNATGAANGTATMVTPLELKNNGVGIFCGSPQYALHLNGNLGVLGTIVASGAITASTAVTACSDRRYKKDISPLLHSIEKIRKIKGVTYNWKVEEFPEKNFEDCPQIGVIAQDLEEIFPELVFTNTDGYKSVDYSRLTPILLEAIKDQQNSIEALEKLNDKYSQRLQTLEIQLRKIESLLGNTAEK